VKRARFMWGRPDPVSRLAPKTDPEKRPGRSGERPHRALGQHFHDGVLALFLSPEGEEGKALMLPCWAGFGSPVDELARPRQGNRAGADTAQPEGDLVRYRPSFGRAGRRS